MNNITCINVPKNGEKGLKGIVTNEDVYNAYPHPDKAIDITLRGHQIKKCLNILILIFNLSKIN